MLIDTWIFFLFMTCICFSSVIFFQVLNCKISHRFFSYYNQVCCCNLIFFVSRFIIAIILLNIIRIVIVVRIVFLLYIIWLAQVKVGCPGRLISLCMATFHAIDLYIAFQCQLMNLVSCIDSIVEINMNKLEELQLPFFFIPKNSLLPL